MTIQLKHWGLALVDTGLWLGIMLVVLWALRVLSHWLLPNVVPSDFWVMMTMVYTIDRVRARADSFARRDFFNHRLNSREM